MSRKHTYRVIEHKLGQMPGPDVDELWMNMREKLDKDMPEEEDKRRFFWLPRINRLSLVVSGVIFLSAVVFTGVVLNDYYSETIVVTETAVPATGVSDPESNTTTATSPNSVSTINKSEAEISNRKATNTPLPKQKPLKTAKSNAHKKMKEPKAAQSETAGQNKLTLGAPVVKKAKAATTTQWYRTPDKTEVKKENQRIIRNELPVQSGFSFQQSSQNFVKNAPALQQNTPAANNGIRSAGNRYHPSSLEPLLTAGIVVLNQPNLMPSFVDTMHFPQAWSMKPKQTAFAKKIAVGAAIHLNLPVSSQEMSTVSVNGGNNKLFDYLPSVYGQYHFHKKMYVQSEFQFIAPQHTPKLTLASSSVATGPNKKQVQSVQLTKLYYMNLPASLHYQVLPNLYVGAGIQFSYLTRSILTEQTETWQKGTDGWQQKTSNAKVYVKSNPNKEKAKATKLNNSNPPATPLPSVDVVAQQLKSNDWRYTCDINYYRRRFNAGVRMNIGMNNYIETKVGTTNLEVHDRNKSFQAYIRYQVWEKKK